MDRGQARKSSTPIVPHAMQGLDNLKLEIAGELGVNLREGDNGHLTARENGSVGGYMVKQLIRQAEQQLAGKDRRPLQ